MRITKPPTIDAITKFAGQFTIQGDCWVWNKPGTGGYGYFLWFDGYDRAHRWFYKAFNNIELSEKQLCDHLCRNRACVNPIHIEIVDSKTNILRGEGIAAKYAAQTHCKRGHEFTTKNTYMNLKGVMRRVCKTCDRARRKIQRERIRQAKELGDSEAEKNSGTWSRL